MVDFQSTISGTMRALETLQTYINHAASYETNKNPFPSSLSLSSPSETCSLSARRRQPSARSLERRPLVLALFTSLSLALALVLLS